MASMVASMRGSSAGRNPTIGIMRLEASSASEPTYWVKALAVSLQPCWTTNSQISSRCDFQVSTLSAAPIAADLPDALVGLPPAAGGVVGAGGQEGPAVCVELVELAGQPVGGAEQFAVDVDLGLVPGAVADPHRAAVPPAGQVRQGAFGQVVFAADPEHDLQGGGLVVQRAGRGGGEEGEEVGGLVGTGGDPERFHGEARVADPGVAVVPVAFAADALGQRGGGGGDDRAAGLERQAVQDAAAVVHQVRPRALVLLVQAGPGLPGRGRRVDLVGQLALAPEIGGAWRRERASNAGCCALRNR